MFKRAVIDVEPRPDYTLLITFAKGKKRIFDYKKFLFDEEYASELKNIDLFMKAKADHHTVMWTEELDISPEYLYENSVKEKNFA